MSERKKLLWIACTLLLLAGLGAAALCYRREKICSVTGYAATYQPNSNDWRFTRECLRSCIADFARPVVVTFNHDNSKVVGVVTHAWVDDTGLIVTIKIARTPYGQIISSLIQDKIITGFSLEFVAFDSIPNYDVNLDKTIEVFRRIRIVGMCLVVKPADPCARITEM